MPEVIDRRLAFNGGEFSPWTDARIDLEKYRTACRQLVNMRPTVYGGAFRRPGTMFMGEAAAHDHPVRLVEFEFSVTVTLILEFSHLLLRIWTTGDTAGLVEDPGDPGEPLEIVTPWKHDQLFALQFAQQNDIVFIVHPDVAPHKLSRLATNSWTLAPIVQEWPALLDPNITAVTIDPSAVTGNGITLAASANIFQPGHVGSIWVIRHRRTETSVQVKLNATVNDTSGSLFVLGEWSCNVAVNTGGNWDKDAVVERSYDLSTWETIRSISSSGIASGTIAGNELDPCWLRIRITATSGSTPFNGAFILEAGDPDHYGIVRIASYVAADEVTADVIFRLGGTTATKYWAEGAWSDFRGYPRAVTFHESRLFFGGTAARPQTVWGSIIDDYLNFRTGSDEDMGLAFTLASDAANGVQWLVSHEALILGTTGSEWALGSRSSEKALGGATAAAKRSTNYGSAHIQAKSVHDVAIFVSRSGRQLREFVYTFEKDGYAAQDLTLLAEHVADGGFVQMAVQKNPETVVWFITGDGELVGLTYERGQNVAGWFRYQTAGKFESVAVIAGSGGEDEIWVSVLRTVDGDPVRYVERLQPGQLALLKESDSHHLAYADSAVIFDDEPATVFTGLDHLEAEEVTILADGAPHPPRTVLGGEIELQFPASVVVVGLPFTSLLEPTWFETNDPNSLSKAGVKRITRATVELWRTLGTEISGDGGSTFQELEFRTPDGHMDAAPPLFSGIDELPIDSGHDRQRSVILRQRQPLPMNVVSLHVRYDLNSL